MLFRSDPRGLGPRKGAKLPVWQQGDVLGDVSFVGFCRPSPLSPKRNSLGGAWAVAVARRALYTEEETFGKGALRSCRALVLARRAGCVIRTWSVSSSRAAPLERSSYRCRSPLQRTLLRCFLRAQASRGGGLFYPFCLAPMRPYWTGPQQTGRDTPVSRARTVAPGPALGAHPSRRRDNVGPNATGPGVARRFDGRFPRSPCRPCSLFVITAARGTVEWLRLGL